MQSVVVQYALLGMGVLLLSTSAIFVKMAEAPSGIIAFYRLLFTLAFLVPALLARKKEREQLVHLNGRQLRLAVISGALLAVHWVMWFESLRYTSVASSTVLVSLQPLFSILFGALFLKEHVTKWGMAGVFLAIAGSAVIGWGDFQVSGAAFWGDVLSFASAGVISLHFLFGQLLRREMDALPYTVVCYTASTVCLAIYALAAGQSFSGYSCQTWGCFLGLALFATVGGQCVFNLLLKYLPASAVTMGILGEPVGTIILAFFIFGESITLQQTAGMLLILGGLWLFFSRKKH
ncbi:MAG: DMT family transporter [Acidaminococcaceae bacterium]|nr:DMT family transporter [Acidaminococcaceae bacterium]MBQ9320000.1 DMT family transporter [Acidaminococcaceae bacterium]